MLQPVCILPHAGFTLRKPHIMSVKIILLNSPAKMII